MPLAESAARDGHLFDVLSEPQRDIVSRIHAAAVAHGCRCRADQGAAQGDWTFVYSAMGLTVTVASGSVRVNVQYDLRALLDFYRHQADDVTRRLLFEAAIPCCFCIDDKCTTLLTDRTIVLGDRRKQLCGPYRHRLDIPVDEATVSSMGPILDMAFHYCTPEMHSDLFNVDRVTYRVEERPAFCVVGYPHRSTMLSVKTEDFIAACFRSGDERAAKLQALLELIPGRRDAAPVGVTKDFVDGLDYTYVLGVACEPDRVPAALPEGVEVVPVGAGAYAIYNSSAGDYRSVWRHFKDAFYEAEHQGYDPARLPFEWFGEDGRFRDVSIPVAPEMPKDSGIRRRVLRTPDIEIAGYLDWSEADFPLCEHVWDPAGKVRAAFPDAPRYYCASVHAKPGQPIHGKFGVDVDQTDVVPEGLRRMTIRGGYWHATGYAYPVSGEYEFEAHYEPARPLDCLNHPRDFVEVEYNGRGAYSEILVPVRVPGQRLVELVEVPVWRLIGKQVRLPEVAITDDDICALWDMPGNLRPGGHTTAFRQEPQGTQAHFAGPVISGADAETAAEVPEGLERFELPGGRYVRLSEDTPNGELDWWTPAYAFQDMKTEIGAELDLSRHFVVQASERGRRFVLYVPVR